VQYERKARPEGKHPDNHLSAEAFCSLPLNRNVCLWNNVETGLQICLKLTILKDTAYFTTIIHAYLKRVRPCQNIRITERVTSQEANLKLNELQKRYFLNKNLP